MQPPCYQTLRAARDNLGVSQRELGRRVAQRLDQPARHATLAMTIRRLELGELRELDAEVEEALRLELALGEGDLSEPVRWAWAHMDGERPQFVTLGLRLAVFTSLEAAGRARDELLLSLGEHGRNLAPAILNADAVAIFAGGIAEALDTSFGELTQRERDLLVVVDPTTAELGELVLAQVVLTGADVDVRRGAAGALADLTREGRLQTLLSLEQLHSLALRRLRLDGVPEDIFKRWCTEESNLIGALIERERERARAHRHRHRARVT